MLKKNSGRAVRKQAARVAVVASRYNALYVNAMVRAAESELKAAGAVCRTVRVPGAYEIPVVAAKLASLGHYDAIVCLGVILRGATTHAQHIGESVSQALVRIQVDHLVPVIHEVLLLEDKAQARERCLDKKHNRGIEAARTALDMVKLLKRLF